MVNKNSITVDKNKEHDCYTKIVELVNTSKSASGFDICPPDEMIEVIIKNSNVPLHKQRYRLQKALDKAKSGLTAVAKNNKLFLTA